MISKELPYHLESGITETALLGVHSYLARKTLNLLSKGDQSLRRDEFSCVGSYAVSCTDFVWDPLHVDEYNMQHSLDLKYGDKILEVGFAPFGENHRSEKQERRLMTMLLGTVDLPRFRAEVKKYQSKYPELTYIFALTNHEMALVAESVFGFYRSDKQESADSVLIDHLTGEKISGYYYVFKPINEFLQEKPDIDKLNKLFNLCSKLGITEKKARVEAIKSFMSLIRQSATVF